MVKNHLNNPVEIFVECIEQAQQKFAAANAKLAQSLKDEAPKIPLLDGYIQQLEAVHEELGHAEESLAAIKEKPALRELPALYKQLSDLETHLGKTSFECNLAINTLADSELENDHIRLLADLKISIQYLHEYGIELMLKTVKEKLCKQCK